jgi:uncharacterized protein (TIGR02001 family)
MRKSILSLAVTAALAVPGIAAAQQAASPVAGNMTLASDYRFRGLTQTFQNPALQGGFDYGHPSGLYLGNWNSNVSSALYPNSNLEMDFYGGYKRAVGDFGVDIGALYYFYPGSSATIIGPGGTCTGCEIDNVEFYVGGSWKWLSAKYFHALDDFFAVPGTKNSWYIDLAAALDLGNGWGVVGHLGRQKVKGLTDADYTDYKVGVTKDIRGYVFGAALVDTDAKDSVYRLSDAKETMNIGKTGLVLSVSKTF